MNTAFTSRRTVLATAGTASAALALAACGGSSGGGDTGPEAPPETQPTGDGASEPGGGGAVLVQTSEVPEGGGKILESEKVVVTQPSAGEFKAFSAVCTHQGCLVSTVEENTINCACHGSRFAIGDGSVAQGPATRALAEVDVSVQDGAVRRG